MNILPGQTDATIVVRLVKWIDVFYQNLNEYYLTFILYECAASSLFIFFFSLDRVPLMFYDVKSKY